MSNVNQWSAGSLNQPDAAIPTSVFFMLAGGSIYNLKSVHCTNPGFFPLPLESWLLNIFQHNAVTTHSLTQSFQQHCEIATIILIFIIENQGPEKQSKLPKTVQLARDRAQIQAQKLCL